MDWITTETGLQMTATSPAIRILLVGADAILEAEAAAFDHPGISFSPVDLRRLAAAGQAAAESEAIVVNLDAAGGLDLVADLCGRPGMPPIIALASRCTKGKSLEHLLLLAELRGAAAALPGPIDGAELALAAVTLLKPAGQGELTRDLERRLAC